MSDPVSLAASIAGLISLADLIFRYSFRYGRAVNGVKEEVQALASEINALSGVLRSLDALASELEDSEEYKFDVTLRVDHLGDCRQTLEKIKKRVEKAEKNFKDRSLLKGVTQQLKWPFSSSETKDLLAALSRHKETTGLATAADSLRMMQALLSKQGEQSAKNDQNMLVLLEISTKISTEGRERRVMTVLEFFLKTNPQENLDQSLKLRQPSTGLWLTQLEPFKDWLNTKESKLWMNGIAGGGKTILAGVAIEEALRRAQNTPKVGVAFFFCDYKNEETLKPARVLGALASQLARQQDDAFNVMEQYYNELHPARALNKQPDAEQLREKITEMSELFSQVIIVIDGLDECGDDSNISLLLEILLELTDYTTTISMAIFSRDESIIREKLEDFEEILIEAHTEDVDSYVRAEVASRLRTNRLKIHNTKLRDEIERELVNRANGMFRWVVCQLDYLGELDTEVDQRLALKELPPTLHDTYRRLLERVNRRPAKVRKIVRLCLHFIACFPTRLSILELRQAVSTPETTGSQVDEANTVTEGSIASWCSSLIRKSAAGNSFEFAHFTVQEFLSSGMLSEAHGLDSYHIAQPKSNSLLALQCLKFIQMKNFDWRPDRSFEFCKHDYAMQEQYPFYNEAALNWPCLAKDGFKDPLLMETAELLFKPHPAGTGYFLYWTFTLLLNVISESEELSHDGSTEDWRAEAYDKALQYVTDGRIGPIHMAASLNLPEMCSFLIAQGADCSVECSLGNPLYLAMTTLSNIRCVDASVREWLYEQYLSSSARRNETIESIAGAGVAFTSLETRMREHHVPVFLQIFEIGFRVQDFTPTMQLLNHAITPSDQEIKSIDDYLVSWVRYSGSQMLADPLFDLINFLGSIRAYDTPWGFQLGEVLWSFSLRMGFAFVDDPTLIDSRISLSSDALLDKVWAAIDDDDTSALQTCLKDGRINIVDSVKNIGGTLLCHAVCGNAQKCVRLLLDLGSDPESRGEEGGVLLLSCPLTDDGTMLKILVERHVSLLTKDDDGETIWHACANHETSWLFLQVLFEMDLQVTEKALLMKKREGHTPLGTLLRQRRDAFSSHEDEQCTIAGQEEKALFFMKYCNRIPSFWLQERDVFSTIVEFGSTMVLEHAIALGLRPEPICPGQKTPLHDLKPEAKLEWVELLKKAYPGALESRFADRLPIEIHVKKVLELPPTVLAYKNPLDVIKSLVSLDIYKLQDSEGISPWEFLCRLQVHLISDNSEGHRDNLDRIWGFLVESKAIETYETSTRKCGLLPCFSNLAKNLRSQSVGVTQYAIPTDALEKALALSIYWDPSDEIVVDCFTMLIRAGNNRLVSWLLEKGVDVHQRRTSECSPIEYACTGTIARFLTSNARGRSLLETLLECSSPIKLREFTDGLGLLHRLACADNSDFNSASVAWLVGLLLDKGVDVDGVDVKQRPWVSPICYHLSRASFFLAEHLLDMGAELGVYEEQHYPSENCNAIEIAIMVNGLGFLHKLLAISKERLREVAWKELVLTKWQQGQVLTTRKTSFLHLACIVGKCAFVEFFVSKGLIEVDTIMEGGYTPLHCASMHGYTDCIEYLVSNGNSINVTTESGDTALHLAAVYGHLEAVKLLISHGASQPLNSRLMTPRLLALERGNHSIVELFDQIELQPAASSEHSKALLRQLEKAIIESNLTACEWLLANGCPLDKMMPDCGELPLCLVSKIRNPEPRVVKWLLENGAQPLKLQCKPTMPYPADVVSFACSNRSMITSLPILLRHFTEHGGDWINGFCPPLVFAAMFRNVEAVQIILKYLSETTQAISSMCQVNPDEVVSKIVNRKFVWQGRMGSALHLAAHSGQVRIAALLLEYGADIDSHDQQGMTPLQLVQSPSMASLLVEAGASLTTIYLKSWINVSEGPRNIMEAFPTMMKALRAFENTGLGIAISDILDTTAPQNLHKLPPINMFNLGQLAEMQRIEIACSDQYVVDSSLLNLIMLASKDGFSLFLNSHGKVMKVSPLPWEYVNPQKSRIPSLLNSTCRQFRRRFAFGDCGDFKHWLNLEPDLGWSPLCLAAIQDDVDAMRNCLGMGALIDFEGTSLGSALMIASACGRLAAVKFLVRSGAATSYRGSKGRIDVFSVARSKTVRSWLLVGRHNEQRRILAPQDHFGEYPGQEMQPWSGIVTAKFRLVGYHERRVDQSSIEYAAFLSKLGREKRGTVLISTLIDGYMWPETL